MDELRYVFVDKKSHSEYILTFCYANNYQYCRKSTYLTTELKQRDRNNSNYAKLPQIILLFWNCCSAWLNITAHLFSRFLILTWTIPRNVKAMINFHYSDVIYLICCCYWIASIRESTHINYSSKLSIRETIDTGWIDMSAKVMGFEYVLSNDWIKLIKD